MPAVAGRPDLGRMPGVPRASVRGVTDHPDYVVMVARVAGQDSVGSGARWGARVGER